MSIKALLYLFAVTLISATVLFYKLGSLPKNVSLDELRFGYFSASLNDSPYTPYYVKFDAYRDSHPTLFLYQNLLAFKLFGFTVFSLRLVSTLYGVFTVIAFFFLLFKIFNLEAAAAGSILLTLQYKFITFSRWTNEASIYFFFLTLCLLLIVLIKKSIESKSYSRLYVQVGMLGISLGLLQHTYASSRVYLLAFPPCLFLILFLNKVGFKVIFKSFLVFLISLGVVLYPLIISYKNLPSGTFNSSSSELPIFSKEATLRDKLGGIRYSTIRTLGMFNFKGSEESCYAYPGSKFLDPITGVLFIAGLIIIFFVLKKDLAVTLIFLFIASMVPSFLSFISATPHEVRASAAIIFTTIFSLTALLRIASLLRNPLIRNLVIIFIMICVGLYNLNSYFVKQMAVSDKCFTFSKESLVNHLKEYYNMRPKPYAVFNPFF